VASVPSYVPAADRAWVTQAAAGTGLPVSVVAAQIFTESDFNAAAVSPTGAEGIAQFEPGTYAAEGGRGSEFTAANELQPYIRLMSGLLAWSGGDVQKALAAYNAGQGNWQAGTGYATTILARAREPDSVKAGAGTGAAGGGGSWPGDVLGFFSDADHALGSASAVALALFQPSSYVRIAVGSLAVILLVTGLYALGKAVAL
jgi:Transglycosylase SLT domain